jgi:demethylmenaquinone methyltransferase/2-methoxy-6-polyprenyl-1,4-benzoquinol methylase
MTTTVREGSGAMFDAIASRYDFVNRVISLGTDRAWRRRAVRQLDGGERPSRVLDLATGTADMALEIAAQFPSTHVVGLDPSSGMLELGRKKVTALGLDTRIELHSGDAEELPFSDGSFCGVTIAFGIRNVVDRPRALREMARVTKPSGRIVILELGEPETPVLGPMARVHIHSVVPWLGSVLSGAREYRYLSRSIAAFPKRTEFMEMMRDCGIANVRCEHLLFGAASIFVGERAS